MAFRAGAELINMEFMQYMVRLIPGRRPTWADRSGASSPSCATRPGRTCSARRCRPGWRRRTSTSSVRCTTPSARGTPKWLDIAIQRAIRSGAGTARGAVLVDFSASIPLGEAGAAPAPCRLPAVEIADPLIEVTHAAHAINGGIRVDEWGQSTVPGLFAVGETIAGPHGADRLGGGMLAACNVFGARAGPRAAEYARGTGRAPMTAELVAGPLGRLIDSSPGPGRAGGRHGGLSARAPRPP